jgi:hypothetical protein
MFPAGILVRLAALPWNEVATSAPVDGLYPKLEFVYTISAVDDPLLESTNVGKNVALVVLAIVFTVVCTGPVSPVGP